MNLCKLLKTLKNYQKEPLFKPASLLNDPYTHVKLL